MTGDSPRGARQGREKGREGQRTGEECVSRRIETVGVRTVVGGTSSVYENRNKDLRDDNGFGDISLFSH